MQYELSPSARERLRALSEEEPLDAVPVLEEEPSTIKVDPDAPIPMDTDFEVVENVGADLNLGPVPDSGSISRGAKSPPLATSALPLATTSSRDSLVFQLVTSSISFQHDFLTKYKVVFGYTFNDMHRIVQRSAGGTDRPEMVLAMIPRRCFTSRSDFQRQDQRVRARRRSACGR